MAFTSWLNDLGLKHICGSLGEFGITAVRELSVLCDSELKDIINELNLQPRQKIKFTVAVRKYELNEAQRVVLTPEEDRAMKKLSNLTKAARNILSKVEKSMKDVRKNADTSRKNVTNEFSNYQLQLKERQKELIAEINKYEQQKLITLEEQSTELATIIAQLTRGKMHSEKLMKISSFEDLPSSEKSVAASVAKLGKLKLPETPATNTDIRYVAHSKQLEQEIKQYGQVSIRPPVQPPMITKLVPTTNTIEVFWELKRCDPGSADNFHPICFGLKITELSSTSGEGEIRLQKEFECESKECKYIIEGVKRDTNYHVAVRSKDKLGWSSYGKLSHVKTHNADSARGKRWTLHMSSAYNSSNFPNTYETLIDGNVNSGAVTGCAGPQYIMAVFDKNVVISSVTLSDAWRIEMNGFNDNLTNGSELQCERSGKWQLLTKVTGIEERKTKKFTFPQVLTKRVRLFQSGYRAGTGVFIIE